VGGGHFARVGIGRRNLLLLGIQLGQPLLVPVLPCLQDGDLGGQLGFGKGGGGGFGGVGGVELGQILGEVGVGAGD
jgi:hypothetical protein